MNPIDIISQSKLLRLTPNHKTQQNVKGMHNIAKGVGAGGTLTVSVKDQALEIVNVTIE